MADSVQTRKQFGKYRLIAHLATGGMADIFLASQQSMGGFEKLLVIKRILPHLSREERFVQMFLDEARIAAVLNHPNVVQIFDLGRIDGQYFIAMEYLSGESLSMVVKTGLKRGSALPADLAAGILLQAAEGLHHAHLMPGADGKPLGIVHRDVSPQNIFVLYDGGVKVVDFGIAKAALRSTHTRTGTLKGKYAYMSPEQILGHELDARADVFSLGVVLWECLTGRKLFRHESELRLMQSITEEDAPPPETVNPTIPPELCKIAQRALARDREQRFQSAAELRAALAAYIKQARAEADTVAISEFMRTHFADRVKTKRLLIEGAKASDRDLGETLFGDINQYASDTEYSIPNGTPPPTADAATLRRLGRNLWLAAGLLLLLVALGGGGAYLWLGGKPAGGSDAGVLLDPAVATDAGVPAPIPDAGIAEPAPDAGVSEPEDAGAPAAADPGAPPTDERRDAVRPPKRKRIIATRPPRPTNPPVAAGPPGILRLTTNPWTEVYFQGKKLGQTPLVDVELPAGLVRLRVVNQESGIDRELVIPIKSGERITKRFNLF